MPRSFDTGAWTSEVAERMAAGLKPIVRHEMLKFFDAVGKHGATDQELENALGRPGNTLRPCRVDLVREGYLQDSGQWRFTIANRPAIVWVPTWKTGKKTD